MDEEEMLERYQRVLDNPRWMRIPLTLRTLVIVGGGRGPGFDKIYSWVVDKVGHLSDL
jgi:hypothetical protein